MEGETPEVSNVLSAHKAPLDVTDSQKHAG